MRRLWNIARRVDVGSVCVDRGQSPLTYLLYTHANRQGVDISDSVTVCVFVRTVTDLSDFLRRG